MSVFMAIIHWSVQCSLPFVSESVGIYTNCPYVRGNNIHIRTDAREKSIKKRESERIKEKNKETQPMGFPLTTFGVR